MVPMLSLCLIWYTLTSHETYQDQDVCRPSGVIMCKVLCESYGRCQSPRFEIHDLTCHLYSVKEPPWSQHKERKKYYRKIISKLKTRVVIKNKIVPRKRKIVPDGHEKIQPKKETFNIKLQNERRTWHEARNHCKEEGGQLVKVDTKQKQYTLDKMCPNHKHCPCWWIGLRETKIQNKHQWVDGSSGGYTNWKPGRIADTNRGRKCVLNCVLFWKEKDCKEKHTFVCELL